MFRKLNQRRIRILAASFAVIATTLVVDNAASANSIENGVRVGSIDLGNKSFSEAEELLETRADQIASTPAVFLGDQTKKTVDPEDVGFFPDVEQTLADAKAVGRSGHFFARQWQRVRSWFANSDLSWSSELEQDALDDIVSKFAEELDDAGAEAGIEVDGDKFVAVEATSSTRINQSSLKKVIKRALETWPRVAADIPFEVKAARTDEKDAERAADTANEIVSKPITLTTPTGSIELARNDLIELLEAVPIEVDDAWELKVKFSESKVTEKVGPRMKDFEKTPKNASFAISGNSVSVRAGETGTVFDPKGTSEALTAVAFAGLGSQSQALVRSAQASFSKKEPDLTTKEAEDLNITEMVSTFTTKHPCCQPRVKNIHKMADALDGATVRPGSTFSLNKYVGQRTTEKGYVLAPMIFDGEFKDSVGGGVSQLATTFYNAVFFGGYDIVYAKAHSYFISRYPAGREATVSWPAPDLKFRNDSSSGVLIKTSYTNTSVTVTFYGNDGGNKVTADASERTNFKEPEQKREFNAALRPGVERVKSKGTQGFDITVTRIITKSGGDVKRERILTRYKAEPRIIEYGPAATPGPSGPIDTPPPGGPTPAP